MMCNISSGFQTVDGFGYFYEQTFRMLHAFFDFGNINSTKLMSGISEIIVKCFYIDSDYGLNHKLDACFIIFLR